MITAIAFGIMAGSLLFAIHAIEKLKRKIAFLEDCGFRTFQAYHAYMDAVQAGKKHDEAMDVFEKELTK